MPVVSEYSIVIPSRGKAAYTELNLSRLEVSVPPGTQFVLVDDATEDNSVMPVYAAFEVEHPEFNVEIIRFHEPVGAVVGRNRAMERIEGEYVVWLDNDCTPRSRDWLARLRKAFDDHPGAGIAGPMIVYPLTRGSDELTIQCAGCMVSMSGRTGFRGRGEPAKSARWNREEALQATISACWMFPRALWDELGPLDEAFSPCQFEDIDYCYRARAAGREVRYVPAVKMYHFENVTSGGLPDVGYAALTARNSVTFTRKWSKMLQEEGAPHPSSIEWRKDVPSVRLEDVEELGFE